MSLDTLNRNMSINCECSTRSMESVKCERFKPSSLLMAFKTFLTLESMREDQPVGS